MDKASPINTASVAMWCLVERYTGRVGYKGGIKAEGLSADPRVIDCSGWVSFLLSTAMKAVNDGGREMFSADEMARVLTWSDRIILEIETQTGFVLEGDEISSTTLPHLATIGLRQGGGAWAQNHPRPRGITHVVQIVRRPEDLAPFVSESQGWAVPYGVRRLPLSDWLETTRDYLKTGNAWAVDAFTTMA